MVPFLQGRKLTRNALQSALATGGGRHPRQMDLPPVSSWRQEWPEMHSLRLASLNCSAYWERFSKAVPDKKPRTARRPGQVVDSLGANLTRSSMIERNRKTIYPSI